MGGYEWRWNKKNLDLLVNSTLNEHENWIERWLGTCIQCSMYDAAQYDVQNSSKI